MASGWNGSGGRSSPPGQPKTTAGKAKAPSPLRGVVAGALVAVLAAGAMYWFFGAQVASEESGDGARRPGRGLIAEASPDVASPGEAAGEPARAKPAEPEKPIWERPIPEGLDEDSRAAWKRKMAYEKKRATDQRLRRYLEKHKPQKSIYRSGTEQVLDWIFYTQVGDHPPPPLPQMSQFELEHIDEILDSVNEIKEDDDERMAERKRIVDGVKKELRQFLKEGGTVQEFLEHYRNELVAAYEMKGMVASEISREINNSTDSEESLKFIERANKVLEEKGIPAVELTEEQKETLAEGFKDEDK